MLYLHHHQGGPIVSQTLGTGLPCQDGCEFKAAGTNNSYMQMPSNYNVKGTENVNALNRNSMMLKDREMQIQEKENMLQKQANFIRRNS